MKAWWFCSADRVLPNGDGRSVEAGVTHRHDGRLVLCESGLHASRHVYDALLYAPGPVLCRVECGGEIVSGADKLVCSERRYLAVVDATDMLRRYARLCALDVVDKWDAPEVVRRYLRTGDESLRAAASAAARDAARAAARAAASAAAWAAARDAAWVAARDAASAAAWDAAEKKQRDRLGRMARELCR